MSAQAKFDKAVAIVQTKDGPIKPSQKEQLEFYSLFKQANLGDVTGSRPGLMDFTGRAKWDAWNGKKGMDQEEAKLKYVEKLKEVLAASDAPEAKTFLEELEAAE